MARKKKQFGGMFDMDMTPMIDMTFQLIAFFMFVLNFSDAEQNELIQLPSSELAQPPETPFEKPITLQMTEKGTVWFAGEEVTLEGLEPFLVREVQVLRALDKSPADATVIIRADNRVETGRVQDLMALCQRNSFVKFALRARQEASDSRTAAEKGPA
jgi:biopolymer transport protein ExbD